MRRALKNADLLRMIAQPEPLSIMTRIYINGDLREIAAGLTLDQLLTHLKVRPASVVTEHNEKVIPRRDLEHCALNAGDKVEIVRFVGGG